MPFGLTFFALYAILASIYIIWQKTIFFFFKKEEILSMYYINYVVTILLGVQKTEKSNESGLTFSDIET